MSTTKNQPKTVQESLAEQAAISRMFDEFLFEHPSPTREDWKGLVQRYPERTQVIAEFVSDWLLIVGEGSGDGRAA